MTKSLKNKLNELSEARRESILAEADRLYAEYLMLEDLRKAVLAQPSGTLGEPES